MITLLIDVPNLVHRGWHARRGLHPRPGTLGLLTDLAFLSSTFSTTQFAFCFDEGRSLRATHYPKYKANHTPNEEVNREIGEIRVRLLPALDLEGLIYSFPGWEADDWLGLLCKEFPPEGGDQYVIVSSDQDLYQCLKQGKVSIWNPHRKYEYTEEQFQKDYGLFPGAWPKVLALAGCPGDNVEGVPGVAVGRAVKHLKGQLGKSSRAFSSIIEYADVVEANLPLVTVPYPALDWKGLKLQGPKPEWKGVHVQRPAPCPPVPDEVWNAAVKTLWPQLIGKAPRG